MQMRQWRRSEIPFEAGSGAVLFHWDKGEGGATGEVNDRSVHETSVFARQLPKLQAPAQHLQSCGHSARAGYDRTTVQKQRGAHLSTRQ